MKKRRDLRSRLLLAGCKLPDDTPATPIRRPSIRQEGLATSLAEFSERSQSRTRFGQLRRSHREVEVRGLV